MQQVLLQMAALIACGVAWRYIQSPGVNADTARRVLTGLVYTILLPAMVMLVLWRTPLGWDALRIAFVAISGVFAGLIAAHIAYRLRATPRTSTGAMLLAAAFPNVTYLGLPVLEKTFGPWARSVAIQYDLFACTPLLLTAGILIARAYGEHNERENPFVGLLKVPPLWTAVAALALNAAGVPLPLDLEQWLQTLANGVVPLTLISLGMALTWDPHYLQRLPLVVPVLIIQLLFMPLVAWGVALGMGLTGDLLTATVLEAAMPCMVLGMVLCDRYNLDTQLYATTVTLSTALSLFTLPLWYAWLT